MSKSIRPENQGSMDWLDELVEANPEARKAARDEELRLNLSRALREAREAAGMTQGLVAEAMGVGQSVVSRLEKPRHNHTVESVLKYLDAVGADLVLSVVVEGQQFAATEAAARTVVLPVEVSEQARARGLSLREHVLNCTTRQEAVRNMVEVFREEFQRHMTEMRMWMRTTQSANLQQPRIAQFPTVINDGSEVYMVAA